MSEIYIVTGASSGIGYELCRQLAKCGKKVVAIARRQDRLDKLKSEAPEYISVITADLATVVGREFVVKQLAAFKHINGLVNNAASNGQIDYLENLTLDNWHKQCAINLDAPIFLTQALIPQLNGSRIINMTTGTTRFIISGVAGYAITKAAINMFTKYLSEELRAKNILVTAAHPGVVDTELGANLPNHPNQDLAIVQVRKKLKQEDKFLAVELSAKFLTWLLLDADSNLYTGDIIGAYNQQYQLLWHGELLPSPYLTGIDPP
jgi:benzil reductase ((S)-benzoin forming)